MTGIKSDVKKFLKSKGVKAIVTNGHKKTLSSAKTSALLSHAFKLGY